MVMDNIKQTAENMGGKIVPLSTFMEYKAAVETVEVYTVPVPAKKANLIVNALRETLPPQNKTFDLQHLRRLVKEEFLPKQVLARMHASAIVNSLAVKVDECAIVDADVDQDQASSAVSVMSGPKSRTSSTGSNDSNRSGLVLSSQKPSDANSEVSVSEAKPGQEQQQEAPKKKSRRRSSAEKRAAKRERERVFLQKLKALEGGNENSPDCAVESPPTSPTETSLNACSFDQPASPRTATIPISNAAESTKPSNDENTPPAPTPHKRRRRSSGHKRRSRAGSGMTEANPSTGNSSLKGPSPPKKPPKISMLHLLIAPAPVADLTTIHNILRPLLLPATPEISTIEVPLHTSISQKQADEWSVTYWPAIFKRGNPFGPHPPYVEQTINQTIPKVAGYMALVKEAAKQAEESGNGIAAGALVVDPSNEEVVAIAGDGRFMKFGEDEQDKGCTWGNPLEHAIMRVVGMVAAKRKLREELEIGTKIDIEEGIGIMHEREDTLRYIPSTEIEKKYFYTINTKNLASAAIFTTDNSTAAAASADDPAAGIDTEKKGRETGEYLCHNHIVYLTHEPCVMCSMALIHSRIGMVVIDGRNKANKPGWGGLYVGGSQYYRPAEERQRQKNRRKSNSSTSSDTESITGAGYGLFWRKELNWKFLAFEWIPDEGKSGDEIEGHDFYV